MRSFLKEHPGLFNPNEVHILLAAFDKECATARSSPWLSNLRSGSAGPASIGEACNYMASMEKKRELLNHWQRVAKLVLAKEDVLTVSRALELALFMDAQLDVSQLRTDNRFKT
jgi:hypothetical protein